MREEDIDKLLKNKMQNAIQAPESLKSRINYEINNMKEKKTKKTSLKVMQSIAAMAVISILGVTTYATVTKNPILEKLGLIKGSTIYEEVGKEINQDLSNEYANITLKRMASDSAYIIMEYNVILQEKDIPKFGEIELSFLGDDISIGNSIKINDKKTDKVEYVNKISDKEYQVFQIIQIANIESKDLKIEISEEYLYLVKDRNYIEINKKVLIDATKNENTQLFKTIEKTVDDKKITIENFQSTTFETFVKVSVDIPNVTKEDLDSPFSEKNPYNLSFTMLDKNNNYISNICYMKKLFLEDENGNKLDILSNYNDEDRNLLSTNTNVHLEYIITLGDIDKEISELKLIPFIYILPDERSEDYYDYYNNLKWNKLESGEYKQKSTLGGEISITKMEADIEKIKFSYDLKGIITGQEEKVLLRINDENLGFNIICPTNTYTKNINSEENSLEFYRNTVNLEIYDDNFKEEDYKLKDISKIEFALLAEPTIKLIDAEINLAVPKEKESYLTINKIDVKNIEKDTTNIKKQNVINDIVDLKDTNTTNEIENNAIIENNIEDIYKPEKFGKKDNRIGDIVIGMTETEVKELLGEPIERYNSNDGYVENTDNFMYVYEENLNIAFKPENGINIVYLINTYRTQDEGPRGIKVGDTKDDIIKSFYYEDTIITIDQYIKQIYNNQDKYYGTILSQSDNSIIIEYGGDELLLNVYLDENEKVKGMTLEVLY